MGFLESARREARFLSELVQTYAALRQLSPGSERTFVDLVEAQALARPEHVAIAFEERALTFRELDAEANRMARWARGAGVVRGDTIALSMENRPEFLISWLGLAKLGAVTALLNTNLRGASLAHGVREVSAKHWIVGAELAESAASAVRELEPCPPLWLAGAPESAALAGAKSLDEALAGISPAPLDRHARRGMTASDLLLYIYTSGTTGLPKAARVSHLRAMRTALAAARGAQLTPNDRFYVALPLYHSAGGVMAAGGALLAGATLVLARRFSTRGFWSDCARHEVTAFQYIGELCRFLVNAPPHPDEARHAIRVCIGNGLRPDVWERFQSRFRIPRVIEFYGATEGNVALVNLDGKPGAVGRLPGWLRRLTGVEVVRWDPLREEPLRDAEGFCARCEAGEAGELIGRISPLTQFEGYSNAAATEKKILRDVFARGDAYFRTGDLLRFDTDGYFYFVDRVGDTFRWKGENVATTEVAEVIGQVPGVREVNVYGVAVPGHEGRAGMAALVAADDLDLAALRARVHAALPSYARPVFLRRVASLDVTGTLKHRKLELGAEGFDPGRVRDPLYVDDAAQGAYVPLDAARFAALASGALRI